MSTATVATQTVVSPTAFAAAIAIVAPYAANDLSRPILSGVNLRTRKDALVISATDGFAVAEYVVPCDHCGDISTTVPAKDLVALAKAVAKAPSQLTLTQDGDTLTLLTCDGVHTLTEIPVRHAVTYPDVSRLIPRDAPAKLLVTGSDLRRTVLSFEGFARQQSDVIKIAWNDGKLALSAHCHGAEISVSIDAGSSGADPISTALSYTYLARIARAAVRDNVIIGIGKSTGMVTVQWSALPGLTVGVMPMVIGG